MSGLQVSPTPEKGPRLTNRPSVLFHVIRHEKFMKRTPKKGRPFLDKSNS